MKIVIVTDAIFGNKNFGGHETRIMELFSKLAEYNDVHLVQISPSTNVWKLDNKITVHDLSPLFGRLGKLLYSKQLFLSRYFFYLKLNKFVNKLNPDIVDFNCWAYPIFKKKYLLIASSSIMSDNPNASSFISRLVKLFDFFLLKYKIKKSDYVIFFSKQNEEKYSPIANKYSKKYVYIPNGIDANVFFPKNKETMRKKHNLPLDKKIIMYSSRLVYYKRPYDYLAALKLLPNEYYGIIAGDGEIANDIKQWIIKNKMEDKVIMVGKLDKYELAEMYSASDMTIYPTEFEVQPLVPQEAMACGSIPIVSNTLGNNEIVLDKENGLLFELGNINDLVEKIQLISNNNEMQEYLIKGGLEYMKNRTWINTAKKTEEIYKKVLMDKQNKNTV